VAAPAREVVHLARDVDSIGEHGVFCTQAPRQSESRRVRSTAITLAPKATTICTALRPTPPTPTTVTHSPGLTPARALSAR
jgi:hypothetical protein